MRDADLVTVDLNSVRCSEVNIKQKYSPNGFDGQEICAATRYAGISNRVSSFGIYEYNPSPNDEATTMLIAQMIWYFIEGFNCRVNDDNFDNLDEFLEHVGLVNENQTKTHSNSVKLMTLHAAKGLEFDHVYLPGWEEGIFPSSCALEQNSSKSLEEERRLAYVGITRAKFDLNLSYATSRYTYGMNNYSLPSRFLNEISKVEKNTTNIIEKYSSSNLNKRITSDNTQLSPGKKRMLDFLKKNRK